MVTTQLNMVRLGDKSLILRGGSPRPIQNYITTAPDGINWIKIGDVSISDKYIRKTNEKIKPSGVAMSRVVNPGDLILSNSMSFGRPYILQISGCIHDGWLVIQNYQDTFEPEYLLYALGSEFVKKQYIAMAAGSSVQNLNKEKVSDVVLWAPVKTEQKQILQALSDIDSLIDNTEKLIEKKKAIKQGVMQELLTGRRRLPGFAGEWQEVALSDLCYLITKQTGFDYSATIKPSLTTSQEQNVYSFIQNKDFCGYDVNYDTDFYIPKDVAESFPRILLSEPCLLISISGRIGNVAYFQNEHTAFAGGAVGIAKFKDTTLIEWCMLYLQSDAGQKQIFLNEKIGAQHNLTVADVRDLQIMLPDVEERLAIQDAIRDMDKDILLIEEKLQKYKYLKQGMMNKLLTGEIRLVE